MLLLILSLGACAHYPFKQSDEGVEWRQEILRLNARGAEYQLAGSYESALWAYQKALDLAKRVDALDLQGLVLHNMGSLYQARNDLPKALNAYSEAFGIHARLGDSQWLAIGEIHRAGVLVDMARIDEAEDLLEKALSWAQKKGNTRVVSLALGGLAKVQWKRNQLDEAEQTLRRAVDMDRKSANERLRATHLAQLGALLVERGRLTEAGKYLQEALALDKSQKNIRGIALDLYHLTHLHQKAAHVHGVMEWGTRALPVLERLGMTQHLEQVRKWMTESDASGKKGL